MGYSFRRGDSFGASSLAPRSTPKDLSLSAKEGIQRRQAII